MSVRLSQVFVVVPARDEERLLPRCLDAIATAADRLSAWRPEVAVEVVVVADRCRDRTAEESRARGAHVVETVTGLVGAARQAGAAEAVAAAVTPSRAWLASTDADTVVPPSWLTSHVALAEAGAAMVLGRAVPDPADLGATAVDRWHSLHPVRTEHPFSYVHGANLGVRLDAYLVAGGWPALAEHEDLHLVDAVRAAGYAASVGPDVVTSARRRGRTPGGYAGFIRTLLVEHGEPDAGPPGDHDPFTLT